MVQAREDRRHGGSRRGRARKATAFQVVPGENGHISMTKCRVHGEPRFPGWVHTEVIYKDKFIREKNGMVRLPRFFKSSAICDFRPHGMWGNTLMSYNTPRVLSPQP